MWVRVRACACMRACLCVNEYECLCVRDYVRACVSACVRVRMRMCPDTHAVITSCTTSNRCCNLFSVISSISETDKSQIVEKFM